MAEILTPRALASDANCSANGFQTLCSTPAGLASNRIHSIEAKPSRRAQSSSSTPPRIKTPTRIFFARSFPHRPLARNPANRSFMRIEKSLRKSNGDRPPLLTTPRDESAKLSAVLSQSQRHDGSHRSMLTLAPSDGETAVFVGYVWFPLTLTLSLREREHRIPRCNESRRSGLAKARRAILPLPKGGGEGERTLETPMRLAAYASRSWRVAGIMRTGC